MDIQKDQVALLQGQLRAAEAELHRRGVLVAAMQSQMGVISHMLACSLITAGDGESCPGEFFLQVRSDVFQKASNMPYQIDPFQVADFDGIVLRLVTPDSPHAGQYGLASGQPQIAPPQVGVSPAPPSTMLLGADGKPVKQ